MVSLEKSRKKIKKCAVLFIILLIITLLSSNRFVCFLIFTDFSGGNLNPQVEIISDMQSKITLDGVNGNRIPMILNIPPNGEGRFPVVILYSGHGGTKEGILKKFAPLLAEHGIASLAIDLADHGEKSTGKGTFWDDLSARNILRAGRGIRESIIDGKRAASWLRQQSALDGDSVGIIGQSLGSYIGLIHASVDKHIRFLVINVLGTQYKENSTKSKLLKLVKQPFMPEYHASRLSNCPVLMLNGRYDNIVAQEGSKILYRALSGPKKIIWFDSGHSLPNEASETAVLWIAKQNKN